MTNQNLDMVQLAIARQLRHLRSVTSDDRNRWMTAAAFGPGGTVVITIGDRDRQLQFLNTFGPGLDRQHTGGEDPAQHLQEDTGPLFGRNWRRVRGYYPQLLYQIGSRNHAGLLSGLIAVGDLGPRLEFVKAGDTRHPGLFREIARVVALVGPARHRFEMRKFKSGPIEPIVIESPSLAALFADEDVPARLEDRAKMGRG